MRLNPALDERTLTWIFNGCDDHLETICVRAPAIRDILEGDEVRPRVESAHRLFRVAARQIRLK